MNKSHQTRFIKFSVILLFEIRIIELRVTFKAFKCSRVAISVTFSKHSISYYVIILEVLTKF